MNNKIDKFNVVELKDNNRATILDIVDKDKYFVEIVNTYGITIEKKIITSDYINKLIY